MYEQDNAILTEILLKVKYDITSGILLINVSRFSPHQLAFENVNLPPTMNNQLPVGYSTNPLITEHLIALQSTQESFMKAKSSAKLSNTLKKQNSKYKIAL